MAHKRGQVRRGYPLAGQLPFPEDEGGPSPDTPPNTNFIIGAGTENHKRAYHLATGGSMVLNEELPLEDSYWGLHYGPPSGGGIIVGRSPPMLKVYALMPKLAGCKLPILITGRTGSGKEVIARALGSTVSGPFVPLDCAGIPETLLESAIFGHVTGAFTDAVSDRKGWVEVAEDGTLLLDEVGDCSLTLQVKLLRFTETRVFSRLGASEFRTARAWIIAATNRCLEDEMLKGRFREDLYSRLSVLRVRLPDLRERGDDSLLLTAYFIRKNNLKRGKKYAVVDHEAVAWIREHSWPRNVRELKNAIDRVFVLGSGEVLRLCDLRDEHALDLPPMAASAAHATKAHPQPVPIGAPLAARDQQLVQHMQQIGRPATTAELALKAGVDVRTVQRGMRRLLGTGLVTQTRDGKEYLYVSCRPPSAA